MGITLPLDKMTVAEKLEAMESLWNDLSQEPGNVPSPKWHEEILQDREEKITNGQEHFADWNDAKQKLLNSLS